MEVNPVSSLVVLLDKSINGMPLSHIRLVNTSSAFAYWKLVDIQLGIGSDHCFCCTFTFVYKHCNQPGESAVKFLF